MGKVTSLGMLRRLLVRTVIIIAALTLFFSLMVGMYYKNEPRSIKTAIVDIDHSALSRDIIFSINSSDLYKVVAYPTDYEQLKMLIDNGKVDVGLVIPEDTYKNVLNRHPVNILALLNGTANPIVPKLSLGGIMKILMTMNMQMQMHLRVEDLGSLPNTRHIIKPPLNLSERVFYSPKINMESSMLPAFMGLAMQIVSMVIILLALRTNHKQLQGLFPKMSRARQLPVKGIVIPIITSWIIVGTAISTAFFLTLYIFGIPTPPSIWNTVIIFFIFVLSMDLFSAMITLNIDNVVALIAIITLIVMPAFMYSGFLVPMEQMADLPKAIGGYFPLRYYLNALYLVFNHHMPLSSAYHWINILYEFIGGFSIVIIISIIIGSIERKGFMLKMKKPSNETPATEIPEVN